MENHTLIKEFQIIGFSSYGERYPQLFIVFLFMYFLVVLGNLVIISVVFMDSHLHTPMYVFLCNLSCVDVGFSTITLPKLIDMILTGNNSMSSIQCFTQMYFYVFVATTEVILLSAMAYDRNVAISDPLRYHVIMNKKKCALLLGGTWILGCVNSLFVIAFASNLSLCHSNKIEQFYCDVKALAKIACVDTGFYIIIFMDTLLLGLCPFLLSVMSYINIIIIILNIKSTDGRRKAFSTCTSHLTVLIIFYGTIMCMYTRPPSKTSGDLDMVFSILYSVVTPMLNPLIYSLRNKEVKRAALRIMGIKIAFQV